VAEEEEESAQRKQEQAAAIKPTKLHCRNVDVDRINMRELLALEGQLDVIQAKDKVRGVGHVAWGMEHGAWGMGHGAWGMDCIPLHTKTDTHLISIRAHKVTVAKQPVTDRKGDSDGPPLCANGSMTVAKATRALQRDRFFERCRAPSQLQVLVVRDGEHRALLLVVEMANRTR
jgi:hypothetical protein